MNSLKDQVRASATELKTASVSGIWETRQKLFEVLERTTPLFHARETAWGEIRNLSYPSHTTEKEIPSQENIFDSKSPVDDFIIQRHLRFVAYMTTTWSIYDRLANVCGRLTTGDSDLANHVKQNPKLYEHFLEEKQKFGFGVQDTISKMYAWPIAVSYQIRNWFVHEGFDRENTPLFSEDTATKCFIMHEDARKHIATRYDDTTARKCCLKASADPWDKGDLIEILEKYHEEIDTMFTSLLKWSTASFVAQIDVFAR